MGLPLCGKHHKLEFHKLDMIRKERNQIVHRGNCGNLESQSIPHMS